MKKINKLLILLIISVISINCGGNNNQNNIAKFQEENKQFKQNQSLVNPQGMTIETRYNVPNGYKRVSVEKGSFGEFLRNQKLKPYGEKVLYYNGQQKLKENVYDSVVDREIGDRDLHQCADAIMLLRAEYFYNKGEYENIHFNFVSGFKAEYSKWMNGYRINPNGKGSYYKKAKPSNSYKDFRNFMNIVFGYAGTLSLEKEMKLQSIENMKIGDVFIMGGSPGHAVIIADMAENEKGEKIFLLLQSYMPAQETQVLVNPENPKTVWYSLKGKNILYTPEWRFPVEKLRKF